MKSCIVTLLMLFTFSSFAQEEKRNFHTLKYLEYLVENEPSIKEERSSYEKFYKQEKKYDLFEPKIVPIVFHVLYSSDDQKVSESSIHRQVDQLNEHFSFTKSPTESPNDPDGEYLSRAVDTKISFCFPKANGNKDPIIYEAVEVSEFTDYESMKAKRSGGSNPWNTNKYLNVWICNLGNGMSGFAQMPIGPNDLDGIVIDYKFIDGSHPDYNEGTTLTHLIGNYLNLYPLWGEEKCLDDMIEDTPIHNDPNISCPDGPHITLCGENILEMTMNFMDNTNDACQFMFTQGQMERMHLTLSPKGPRKQLVTTESKCEEPEVEEALVARSNKDALSELIEVYPNPVNKLLYIRINSELIHPNAQLKLYELTGKVIHQLNGTQLLDSDISIDVSGINQGIYLLEYRNGTESVSRKVIVQ